MTISPNPSEKPEIKPLQEKTHKETIVDYFKTHMRETISYVLLIIGILLLFFYPIYGGILVGTITGIYFGDEIIKYILHWKENLHTQGMARPLISAGIAIAFFISAPAIFLGAAIAIGIKQLFIGQNSGRS